MMMYSYDIKKSNKKHIQYVEEVTKSLIVLTIVLLFHVVRNISTTLYAILLISSALVSINAIFQANPMILFSGIAEGVFFTSMVLMPINSVIHGLTQNEILVALLRYGVILLYIIITIMARNILDKSYLDRIETIYIIFITLSALSILYQIGFGQIAFLADASERSGLPRYASLAGSLTAFGTVGPIALLLILWRKDILNKKIRLVCFILILTALLSTLQKTAYINLIIILMLYTCFKPSIYKALRIPKRIFTVVVVTFALILVAILYNNETINSYISNGIQYTFNNEGSKYSTQNDLILRQWELPSRVAEETNFKWYDIVFGVGLKAYGGIMGLDSPQTHNDYFSLLLSGGILLLGSYLILFIKTIMNNITNEQGSILLLILINMFAGEATIFQPVIGVMVISIIMAKPCRRKNSFSTYAPQETK